MKGSTACNETPETRPNLQFARINGAIKADLTVLDEYDLDQRLRVSIVLGTVNQVCHSTFLAVLLFVSLLQLTEDIPLVISSIELTSPSTFA
jgi:hypothetical protein